MVETEVRCVWVLTGNNVQLSKELVRRLIMIDLDARVSKPAEREGFLHDDLMGWVLENRGRLVWACLTIIQNWIALGRPAGDGMILNSYENWSRAMGGILKAAGIKGFMENRKRLEEFASLDDDESINPLLILWWENFGEGDCLVASGSDLPSLADLAADNDVQLPIRMKTTVDGDRVFDTTAFGRLLSHHRQRVVQIPDGPEVTVIQEETRRHRKGAIWRLEKAEEIDAVSE
jgi:hypothetical protein